MYIKLDSKSFNFYYLIAIWELKDYLNKFYNNKFYKFYNNYIKILEKLLN